MLIYLLSRTETTAQRYLWLNRRAVVKGIQITSPSFIRILKSSLPPITVVLCAEKQAFIVECHFWSSSFKIVADCYVEKFLNTPVLSKSSVKCVVHHFRTSTQRPLEASKRV